MWRRRLSRLILGMLMRKFVLRPAIQCMYRCLCADLKNPVSKSLAEEKIYRLFSVLFHRTWFSNKYKISRWTFVFQPGFLINVSNPPRTMKCLYPKSQSLDLLGWVCTTFTLMKKSRYSEIIDHLKIMEGGKKTDLAHHPQEFSTVLSWLWVVV